MWIYTTILTLIINENFCFYSHTFELEIFEDVFPGCNDKHKAELGPLLTVETYLRFLDKACISS